MATLNFNDMRNLKYIPDTWVLRMHKLIGMSLKPHSVERLKKIIDCANTISLSDIEREKLERLYAYCNLKMHLMNKPTSFTPIKH